MSGFDPSGLSVYVDGEFVDGAQASVSVFDHGLLYGDGVFEGLRVFEGGLFRPRDHVARLRGSARSLMLDVPLADEELIEVALETVARCGLADAHVRIVLTRGFGTPGLDPWRCERPTLIVSAYPFPPLLGDQALRLMTSSVVRKAPRSVGAHVKSLNYLDAILAKQQARACDADDAIMLDSLGAVAECSATNLFLVMGDALVTPTTRAALPGITRRTLIEVATGLGLAVYERDIWPMELHLGEAAFVTGSAAGVVAVGEIDGRPYESEHPLIAALRDGYLERTRDPGHRMEVSARAGAA